MDFDDQFISKIENLSERYDEEYKLQDGSINGDCIKYAKIFFRELGFYEEDSNEINMGSLNDEYNDGLLKAVRRFQTLFHLPVTGEMDDVTWESINGKIDEGYLSKRENNKTVLMEALSNIPAGYRGAVHKNHLTEEKIEELLNTIEEFNIDDTKELKAFIAHALCEGLADADAIENREKGYGEQDAKYNGGGFMQITKDYNYLGFALYELVTQNFELIREELGGDSVNASDFILSPAHNSTKALLNQYEMILEKLNSKGNVDSMYTDIYDKAKTHVTEHYAWKSAGWFWMTNEIGKELEGCTDEEAMEKSLEKINPGEAGSSARAGVISQVNAVSDILEGFEW